MTSPEQSPPKRSRASLTPSVKGRLFGLAVAVATVGGFAIAITSVHKLDIAKSGALGLIQALPIGYFVGLGLVIVSFVFTLRRENLNRPLLTLELLAIICMLYGLTSYDEHVARLPTTWVHAGFIEYIQRTGHVLKDYDARFVWPGFFAGGAMLNELAGTHNQLAFLSWAPLVFNLAYAMPIWIIARSTGAAARVAWLATLLFFMLNWVGQDYYSPQGLNFAIAVTFLAVLLRMFYTKKGIVPTWLKRTVEPTIRKRLKWITKRIERLELRPSTTPPLRVNGWQKAGVVLGLVLLYGASVVSHQLTPFFLFLVVFALVILDRIETRTLPIFMIIGVFIWISYGATAFWQGNLGNLFGDVGNVNAVASQNVTNRVSGDPAHIPIIYGRLLVAASVWGLAGIGFIRRLRRGSFDLICIVGLIAPFSVLGGQAYGGEAVLRVYLFALPFAVTLGASALAPNDQTWNKKTTVLVLVVLLGLMPTFIMNRYGNEAFEHFNNDELTAVEHLYKIAPANANFVSFNSAIPWRGTNIEGKGFNGIFDSSIPVDTQAALDKEMHPDTNQPSYLIVTRAQKKYAEEMQGQKSDWADGIVAQALATGKYRVVYTNTDSEILEPTGQP